MSEGEPTKPENLSYREGVLLRLKADIETLKINHSINWAAAAYSKSAGNLHHDIGSDLIFDTFGKVTKNGLKSLNPLKNIRVRPVEVPEKLSSVADYLGAVTYEVTAEIHPKYDRDGRPRDITLEVTLRLTGTKGRKGKFDLFVKNITPKEITETVKGDVQREIHASQQQYMEVVDRGIRNPLGGYGVKKP